MELGYLVVKKRNTFYMKKELVTLIKAKIELGTTGARLSGTKGRNKAAWFVPQHLNLDLEVNFNKLDEIKEVKRIK